VTKLPRSLSGKAVIKALNKAGFYVKRQKGSHIILRRDEPFAQVVVPDHKSIDTGTLASILDGANLTIEEFLAILNRITERLSIAASTDIINSVQHWSGRIRLAA